MKFFSFFALTIALHAAFQLTTLANPILEELKIHQHLKIPVALEITHIDHSTKNIEMTYLEQNITHGKHHDYTVLLPNGIRLNPTVVAGSHVGDQVRVNYRYVSP